MGSRRKNMSSRYSDIFMFEMTFHVCNDNSQSIGIFVGGELWKNYSIVANYRIFWDDLYMHQIMTNM